MKAFFVAAALVSFALPAAAQSASNATQQFVSKAAISDMFEIESSKLALEKATNPEIKRFAQTMVSDHTKTSSQLKEIAQKMQSVQVPSAMDNEHQRKIDQLRSANSSAFDQQYRMQQIEGHRTAVALFDDYSKTGDNADLKSFAQSTLPSLRTHLEHAQALPQAAQAEQPKAGSGQQARLSPVASPGPNHILLSDLRGTRVYGTNNENIGDINDVLVERGGKITAVVVGVGGFLGIGEKNVAVPFEAIEITGEQRTSSNTGSSAPNGGTTQPNRVTLKGMNKGDLEAAPSFSADGRGGRR